VPATTRYRNPAIKQLADQQVRFSPVPVRVEQIERAEELLLEIERLQLYEYPELCERITKFRSDKYPDLEIAGEDLLHDLRCFIEDLSESANLIAENSEEPILTVQDISDRFSVSTRTVRRWRDRGLANRLYRFGNRRRVGFLQSFVERFVESRADEIGRSSKFTQLSETDREAIIRRARRLARYGASLTEVTARISKKTGRAQETIRYTIKQFDERYPESAVFPNRRATLTDEDRRDIFRAVRSGVSATRLAERYGRTRSSIYRIATQHRVRTLLDQAIEFMPSDEFSEPEADEQILNAEFELDLPDHSDLDPSSEIPPYLADLYVTPLLTREQEQFLFRKMNFLKFKAAAIRDALPASRQKSEDMDRLEALLEESLAVKNILIRCNLRLVVSIARKHRRPSSNFFEMVSDGNMVLIRAIEKFDYSRGNKFSTYATWAVMRSYARSIPAEGVQLDRFRTGTEELISDETDDRSTIREDERRANRQLETIESILDQLTEREQEAISLRFALQGRRKPMTLEQIGERLGVSRERTRQIINTGLEKLRAIADEAGMELPAE
jgi:RNA polymerase sigma factor (sigma-70 family)